jgi:predicted aconitase
VRAILGLAHFVSAHTLSLCVECGQHFNTEKKAEYPSSGDAMHLDETEKRMLAGNSGSACQLAMKILCELGELFGAERMIAVSQVHIDMTLYMVDAGVEFAEKMAELGGKFAIPTQLNPASVDLLHHERMRVPEDLLESSRRLESAYLKMGATPTWTCAPYQQGLIPSFGEQIAWGESNAVAFANSVIGARTERYADLTDVCAAITGRVPELGLHIAENRKAEILLEIKDFPVQGFNDFRIYPLLGFIFGEIAGDRIAAIEGIPRQVSEDNLKAFSAAAASSGAVGLFHIIGVTPEAPDRKTCFRNEEPKETFVITREMIDSAESRLSQGTGSMPDLITMGCPHYSVDEFRALEQYLNGRKIKSRFEFWVFTSRQTYEQIKKMRLLDTIERSGVTVFTDGCALQYPKKSWDFTCAMSDSAKFTNYCFSQTGLNVIFSGTRNCVETAVAGELKREPIWK